MRILLTRISNRNHRLELVRHDGSRDSAELVTREALFHDLLHFAVESSLPTDRGFWGTLAGGRTIADLNDRTGESVRENAEMLYQVEGIVGVMTGVAEMSAEEALARLEWFSQSQNQSPPEWCNQRFVASVVENMRRLQGRWRATAFGETMEILWPDSAQKPGPRERKVRQSR